VRSAVLRSKAESIVRRNAADVSSEYTIGGKHITCLRRDMLGRGVIASRTKIGSANSPQSLDSIHSISAQRRPVRAARGTSYLLQWSQLDWIRTGHPARAVGAHPSGPVRGIGLDDLDGAGWTDGSISGGRRVQPGVSAWREREHAASSRRRGSVSGRNYLEAVEGKLNRVG